VTELPPEFVTQIARAREFGKRLIEFMQVSPTFYRDRVMSRGVLLGHIWSSHADKRMTRRSASPAFVSRAG
jgi:hypothetical protein